MASPDITTSVYHIIKYGFIFGLTLSLVVLIGGSILVHDTYYITKNPKFFITEALMMGLLTSIPIAYMSYMRGSPLSKSLFDSSLFFFKIVLIHVGFQLSGVYTVLFPKTSNLK